VTVVAASVLRGAASRGATSIMILIVAVVAVAAATAGPTYYAASQDSILRDTMATGPPLGRGIEVVQTGSVNGQMAGFSATVRGALERALGSNQTAARLFEPPVEAIEGTSIEPVFGTQVPVVWRSGVCAHLDLSGSCPARTGDVIISRSLARTDGWHRGQRVKLPTFGMLRITGIYNPPAPSDDYWVDRVTTYFRFENPPPPSSHPPPPQYDAMFTVQSTLADAPPAAQGTIVFDDLLSQGAVRPVDVDRLSMAVTGLINDPQLQAEQAIVTSTIPTTVATVKSSWSALAIPTFLISAELLVLACLLLFLLVTEAVDTRGGDIALAKLRGHGRLRIVGFGISEPAAILAIALPLGALAGWGVSVLLAHDLLRPGTPAELPGLGWAGAAAATAGGLVAVVLASLRTVRRPVVEQWRRANRKATGRSWVLDGILLTCAAAGLVELFLSGEISSAHHSGLSLLVPGLLGLAVAVVASRLLPVICRVGMHRTRSIGAYLALRHVARRPGGGRTMIMLATSFALATFAVAAWAVGQANYRAVARAQSGAPTVLTVSVPYGENLGEVVDRADPTGRQAAAVEVYDTNGADTLAVDPDRFARVASWGPGSPVHSAPALTAALDPPTPSPLILRGDAVRMKVTTASLSAPGDRLDLDVDEAVGSGPTPLELGGLPRSGTVELGAPLVGCPCLVQDVDVVLDPQALVGGKGSFSGTLTLNELQVHSAGGWTTINNGFTDGRRWRAGDAVTAGPAGLHWNFTASGQDPVLQSVNRPAALPAIVAAAVSRGQIGRYAAIGLDGNTLPVEVVATSAVIPGAPSSGVIVDRHFAEMAANYNLDLTVDQVWVRQGAGAAIESRLRAQHVQITAVQQQSSIRSMFGRQGPGLASVLFIAEAGAAAVLAAGGAILGIYLSSRRRRYELAALEATGLRRRTLLTALLVEQSIVLGFGAIVGVAAGVAAIAAVLRNVPEFLVTPAAPALSYVPPRGEMVAVLAIVLGLAALAMVLASISLVRGVRLDQLREAPA
jgi:hypothetical protein